MTALRTEADVTAKLLFPLFENTLGYLTTDIDLGRRVQVTFGRETKTKFADIVISHNRSPVIAVEAKTPTEAVESGIGQVDSYAFALGARFSVVTNGQHLLLRGYYSGNRKFTVVDESVSELRKARWSPLKNLISAKNIALAMDEQANPEPIPDEVKIKDYRRFFRKIHNLIRNGGKLNPGDAFDELSKLLFLKAAEDERTRIDPKKPFLTPDRIEEWEALGNAPEMINKWFQKAVTGQFPDVFDDHPQIRLSPATLKEVIVEIKPFHVRNGDMDVKGRAFEEFLPSQLRGKGLGQYFTPRPIVNFMAALADISIHDVVVDFR